MTTAEGRIEDFGSTERAVEAIDLAPIKFKLMQEELWTRNYVDEVERWYRRYLFLTAKYPHLSIVVTKPIDTFWHHHILDTRKYASDCEQCFGHFLHHFPYFGMRGAEDARNLQKAFEDSLTLIEAEYGESLLDAAISTKSARRPVGGEELPFAGASCSDCTQVHMEDKPMSGQQAHQFRLNEVELRRPSLRRMRRHSRAFDIGSKDPTSDN
jgi:hypothetical protein